MLKSTNNKYLVLTSDLNAPDPARNAQLVLNGALDLSVVLPPADVGDLKVEAVLTHREAVVDKPLVLVREGRRVGLGLAPEADLFPLPCHSARPHGSHGDAGRIADVEADSGGARLARRVPCLATIRGVVQVLGRGHADCGDGLKDLDAGDAVVDSEGLVSGVVDQPLFVVPTYLEKRNEHGKFDCKEGY
jgi:hypothetical protein